MKIILAVFLLSCSLQAFGAPQAQSGPYAPSGWKPKGPSFELPTRTQESQELPDQFGGTQDEEQNTGSDVEVTEEEIQYSGELGTTESTTPFLQYGPPATSVQEEEEDIEATTVADDEENELTVQGLPGVEPAKEFRSLPSERLRAQRLRQQKQKSGRLQVSPSRQLIQGQFQQQFQQQRQFQRQQLAYSTTNGFQPPVQQFGSKLQGRKNGETFATGFVAQQFGRFTVPQGLPAKQRLRPAPVFSQRFVQQSQRQEALDTYGAPALEGGSPAQEYGPPREYGPPASQEVPQEETEVDQPEDLPEEDEVPQTVDEETTEVNDLGDEEEAGEGEIAVSNAVASGRYVLLQQSANPAKLRSGRAPTAAKLRAASNVRQISEPIFTYNQFGQLVRIF